MTIIIYLFIILFFSFLLIRAVDLVVIALRHLATKSHISLFSITAILMALATSLPELSVGITAALEGTPNISLGNVIGSNIANIGFVVAIATIWTGTMAIHGQFIRREMLLGFLVGLAPFVLLIDNQLSRVDGLILISLYGTYAFWLFRSSYQQIGHRLQQPDETNLWQKFVNGRHKVTGEGRDWGKLFLGVALILLSADLIVRAAEKLAISIGAPQFIIGLLLIAVGTSLPELIFSFKALKDRTISMFYGNILGSIVANSTLVIGVTALISPIKVAIFTEYTFAIIFFIIIYLSFWFFARTKHRLNRWEAIILLTAYLLFVYLQLTG